MPQTNASPLVSVALMELPSGLNAISVPRHQPPASGTGGMPGGMKPMIWP
jgi:hypothetical protein